MPEESQAEATPEASGEDMIAGTTVETPQNTVETPQTTTIEVEHTDAPQEFDYAAYQEQVSQLGDGYTPENLPDKFQESRRAMNEAQLNLANKEKEYSSFDPVIRKIREDPKYAEALQRTTEEYFSDTGYQGDTTLPADLNQAMTPIIHELNEVKMKLANQEIDKQMSALKGDMPIDPDSEREILTRFGSQGGDLASHAWAVVGPKMVANAAKSATQATADKIQENNASYVDSATLSATPTEPVDIKDLPQKEIDALMEADLAKMYGGGG
jgi:hypothetical protein